MRSYHGGWHTFSCVVPHRSCRFPLQLGFVLQGELKECIMPVEVEFLTDIGTVVFDGAEVNEELGPDLLAGFAFGNSLQDAALGRRESLQALMFLSQTLYPASPAHEVGHEGRTDIILASADCQKRLHNFRQRAFFEDIALGAKIHRRMKEIFVGVEGEEYNIDGSPLRAISRATPNPSSFGMSTSRIAICG